MKIPWNIATESGAVLNAVAMLALMSRIIQKIDEKYQHHRKVPITPFAMHYRRISQRAVHSASPTNGATLSASC
jgi:hypothetical protein